MENKNFNYNGWKTNGFVALFLIFAALAFAIILFVYNQEWFSLPNGLAVTLGVSIILVSLICLIGLKMLEPNQSRVMVFFGKYRGTFYETGFWWVNPFMDAKRISLRASNLNVEPIKVNDKMGNPVMIGLVLVWKIERNGVYKTVFDIDTERNAQGLSNRMKTLKDFVAVQSDAALRQVAGGYAYDNNYDNANELTLRHSSEQINQELEKCIGERLAIAGIEVVEARINHLAYAPEIAAVMLRRQQADAIIAAREKIVEGAVSMVQLALDKINNNNIVELDEERKAAMVSNLLVVLCADESARPVVNAGTMYH